MLVFISIVLIAILVLGRNIFEFSCAQMGALRKRRTTEVCLSRAIGDIARDLIDILFAAHGRRAEILYRMECATKAKVIA